MMEGDTMSNKVISVYYLFGQVMLPELKVIYPDSTIAWRHKRLKKLWEAYPEEGM
jgi:hypothetical protein